MSDLINIKSRIEEFFKETPAIMNRIKETAKNIVDTGLPIDECALLAKISPVELEQIYELCPDVEQYFELKRLDYKASLLRAINKDKSTKNALTLMERTFPNEYDPTVSRFRAKIEAEKDRDKENPLVQVFQFIQESSSTDRLIRHANSVPAEEAEKALKIEAATPSPFIKYQDE